MKITSQLWKILNSQFGLLIFGFLLTTLVGTILTDRFQRAAWERESHFEELRQKAAWEREKRFEILRRKLDEGQKALEEISDSINLRFYRLNNVFTNILANDINTARRNWKKYFEIVETWNVKLIIYQNKLTRLVDRETALSFNNYETDDPELRNPTSIHGKFFLAHNDVLKLLRCAESPSCSITVEMKKKTSKRLRDLDYETDAFIDQVSYLFLTQATEIEELKDK